MMRNEGGDLWYVTRKLPHYKNNSVEEWMTCNRKN
ncbi:hypothetical protein B0F87_107109 [Methylobacter tundripaludum]|uniref:Uncharacterized protein n=1 Tax=Methylobacter tundripaludum TaxID=173365 RepID=A0A2S6HBR0_9GAMM|nr:hypothetical protein B0F87_107109 [Methylobacter tundripaludum]